jgi:hypothetical protein
MNKGRPPDHDRHRPAAPPDAALHGVHHGVEDDRDEPGDQDHQQDVPHPVGELARRVDGDHDAAGGEDRRQRNALRACWAYEPPDEERGCGQAPRVRSDR